MLAMPFYKSIILVLPQQTLVFGTQTSYCLKIVPKTTSLEKSMMIEFTEITGIFCPSCC